ncbi:MAG: hypothetical protein DRI75_02120 [Bacteroidetes bacterium]|nr:MAG: hypothetical protein DRI75_02120 [Bacteroidota bacterium]
MQKLEEEKFNHQEFCCLTMADNLFESRDSNGQIKYDNVDVIINKWSDGTYGIPIHDGGTSIIEIKYCPWCGKNLKKKK